MHVFVHHLFTNTYQGLRPKGTSNSERFGVEFSTAVGVYTLAREYELPSLEELAKVEMMRLNNELHFSVVLSLVQSAYPDPGVDDLWFSDFLKTSLTSLLQNPSEIASKLPEMKRKTLSVSDLLLKCLKELADDQIILTCDPPATTKAGTTQYFTFRMPIPQLGSLQGSPAKPCELEMTPQDVAEPESVPNTKREKEEPAAAPLADGWCSPAFDEEDELVALEVKKVRKGKLSRKDQERYMILRERSDQRAEEKAAREAEQAAAVAAAADTATEPAPEPIEAKVQPVAGVVESEALDEKAFEVAMEEAELGGLKAKKVRKGKLGMKDRERYAVLRERADKRAREEAAAESLDAPAPEAEFSAGTAQEAPADDVAGQEDDWSLCNSNSRETDPDCELRAEHILGRGWVDCQSCRLFVDGLHQQLVV